jgi:hypothetical protein
MMIHDPERRWLYERVRKVRRQLAYEQQLGGAADPTSPAGKQAADIRCRLQARLDQLLTATADMKNSGRPSVH